MNNSLYRFDAKLFPPGLLTVVEPLFSIDEIKWKETKGHDPVCGVIGVNTDIWRRFVSRYGGHIEDIIFNPFTIVVQHHSSFQNPVQKYIFRNVYLEPANAYIVRSPGNTYWAFIAHGDKPALLSFEF